MSKAELFNSFSAITHTSVEAWKVEQQQLQKTESNGLFSISVRGNMENVVDEI